MEHNVTNIENKKDYSAIIAKTANELKPFYQAEKKAKDESKAQNGLKSFLRLTILQAWLVGYVKDDMFIATAFGADGQFKDLRREKTSSLKVFKHVKANGSYTDPSGKVWDKEAIIASDSFSVETAAKTIREREKATDTPKIQAPVCSDKQALEAYAAANDTTYDTIKNSVNKEEYITQGRVLWQEANVNAISDQVEAIKASITLHYNALAEHDAMEAQAFLASLAPAMEQEELAQAA